MEYEHVGSWSVLVIQEYSWAPVDNLSGTASLILTTITIATLLHTGQ
jgi:hypothetical protein